MKPGATNSLLDVAGLRVGHHHRVGDGHRTGTTVVLAPAGGMVAGVDVRGAAPGTRETELLDPRNLVERVHAVVLTGGSAFGLSAACGVMSRLADAGVGFPVEGGVVPIVPAAVIYDLGRGGAFRATPDASFGEAAYDAAMADAADPPGQPALDQTTLDQTASDRTDLGRTAPGHVSGSVGAGAGAVAGGLAGGVGTASVMLPCGATVAALAVVNAAGSVLDPRGGRPAGARYGLPGEFDHLRKPRAQEVEAWRPAGVTSLNTTIGVVATDLTLTKAQCGKLAAVAHDGLARAIRPAHTMVDGDTVFAVATCARPTPRGEDRVYGQRTAGDEPSGAEPSGAELHDLLAAGADVFSRAVAHAVLAATGREGAPAYLDVFPSASRTS
ncbi:P1 family peptidase [Nonomuraea sp. MCN248]|uniref:P1 family peptidase n=1 Tax=Nonomuraea corallina TaxID=2989783 RepID=A0ABT4SIM4_9ACTN|nr:P1 family peptidase [Nonomuraea corallina]MDA0636840.1 P1 family peptidase [Nonomuraea corallina]